MESSVRDMSNYDMECGICRKAFTWNEYEENNLLCPNCGWDSVRISCKVKNEKDWLFRFSR